MASSSKKRTTMAKLNRESALRDRRLRKEARKAARKLSAGQPDPVEAEAATTTDGDELPAAPAGDDR